MYFDPEDNSSRLKKSIAAAIVDDVITFNEFSESSNRLVAVFDDPVDEFTAGRIRLFQQTVFDACGAYSTVVKTIPACLKVFFELDIDVDEVKADLRKFFESGEFSATSGELGILYVQFAGKIYKK
ncbi:hypothetical protein [Antarctobacter sp.]|uniref:hypothetical protein n=1 Tax=Antarctobacter sp. TaxID=1872577 RepID=UPI002B27ACFE|nr:hypothetical protein [Antarctobacter sp.]